MSDSSFYPPLHGESARRQFRVSLFMVIALALAALLAGFVTPSGWTKSARAHDDAFVGRLVSLGE
jgi:hypothetical protein